MSYICNVGEPSELDRLKAQVNAIQKRIDELSAPYSIVNLCKNRPLRLPGFRNNCTEKMATFCKDTLDTEVWKHFLAIGKYIHSKNGTFVMRGSRYPYDPYYADERNAYFPSKVSQLTKEEACISAEMLDKMMDIFNEYMVKLHKEVTVVDPNGVAKKVLVQPPEE